MVFLIASLAAFTVGAVIGLLMAIDLFKGKPTSHVSILLHVIMVVLGALLAIGAALTGDDRVYVNIAMVVVIVVLGFLAVSRRFKTGKVQKKFILAHASLAVVCYLLLAATVFGLEVQL